MIATAHERVRAAAASRRPSRPSARGSGWSRCCSPSPRSVGGGPPTRCRAWTTGPWSDLGTLRLVPRRLGRDDGRDDVPVGRADGRAVLAHDQATVAAVAAAVHRRLPRHLGGGGRARVRVRAAVSADRRRRARVGSAPAAGSPAGRCSSPPSYELTPLKDVCLGKCRSPLGFLLGSWRDGRSGALRMGAKNGAWCVGCCWALMASLFALGGHERRLDGVRRRLIAVEKILPWRRVAAYGTAAVLLVLGLLVLIAPIGRAGPDHPRTPARCRWATWACRTRRGRGLRATLWLAAAPMNASTWASSRVLSRSGSELRGPRRRTASPWTLAQIGYSMFGRRAGAEDSGSDEVVEGRLQKVERSRLVGSGPRVIGGRERGVEEAWFGAGELEIGMADRPEPESGACRCVRPRADLAHAVGHASRELADRLVTDRREEGVAVGEVPIGGVGDDADHARHLAEHDRVRASRSGQLEAGLDERGPDGAAGTRSPAHRGLAGVPRPCVLSSLPARPRILVDSVHK